MNASRSGRSKSPHPQTPITGAGHFGFPIYFGGQNQDLFPFYSRPTRAFSHQNLIISLLTHTAWCLPTCLVRWWSRIRQLSSCHSYARVGGVRITQLLPNFHVVGACAPEASRTQGLVFGAAGCKCHALKRVSPVKWGLGGKPPMSTRCAKALIEGGPQRIFGYFLGEQKVTPVPPPRRAEPSQ